MLLRPFCVITVFRIVFVLFLDRTVWVEHFINQVAFQPLAVGLNTFTRFLLRDSVRVQNLKRQLFPPCIAIAFFE